MARKFGCSATGITLSPVQVNLVPHVIICLARCSPQPHPLSTSSIPPRLSITAKCDGRNCATQAARASALAAQQGLADRVSFQVADALQQPFADASFDLVWSLESGEHMPDKERFVSELARVCTPGGRIIIVTWCHRW